MPYNDAEFNRVKDNVRVFAQTRTWAALAAAVLIGMVLGGILF